MHKQELHNKKEKEKKEKNDAYEPNLDTEPVPFKGRWLAASKKVKSEALQNQAVIDKVHHGTENGLIRYGEIIQLEHHRSGFFVAMKKSPAPFNTNNKKVVLKYGSRGCFWRILPRFKIRNIGSHVYADDEVLLENIKYGSFVLSASHRHSFPHANPAFRVPQTGSQCHVV